MLTNEYPITEIEQINRKKMEHMATYARETTVISCSYALFYLFIFSFCFLFFFNIHWFESRFTETRVLLFFFWTNSIDYNSTEWFISRSLLVLFGKKSLVYWVCSEESKNGKSRSYGKSWIEAYRLLYNVTNTAFMFPVFYDCVSVFF